MIRTIITITIITLIIGCKTIQLEDWQIREKEVLAEDKALKDEQEKARAIQTYNDYIADGPCCGR